MDIFTLSEVERLALAAQIADGMKCISQLELVHGNLCAKSCYLAAKNRVQACNKLDILTLISRTHHRVFFFLENKDIFIYFIYFLTDRRLPQPQRT